jgi:hypothetical protein
MPKGLRLLCRSHIYQILIGGVLCVASSSITAQSPLGSVPVKDGAKLDFYQDFRNGNLPQALFKMEGPDAPLRIKPEREGLRITLPAEQQKPDGVGISPLFTIKADFELTVGYRIINTTANPAGQRGAGLEVYIRTNSPTEEALGLSRRTRPDGSEVFSCTRMTTNDQGMRKSVPNLNLEHLPAHGKSGQLRVTRVGTKVAVTTAEQNETQFRLLYLVDLGDADAYQIRVGANPGAAANEVDLFIHDLRIRNISHNDPTALAAFASGTPVRNKSLIIVAVLFGIGLLLVGFWFWRCQFWSAKQSQAPQTPGA